ncbi:hydrogen peroxide-inducible genes activator [Salinibacter altiplanensis]|uniref:hydrogen peroxide-inducible genes activator n=1 Tax=Salinibacter altiplanensis TaxID=1803181 RepID=UPI000C9EED15|nr:hydrogen peroxide-inducible genes activator [Salinibacter altiplanensis]
MTLSQLQYLVALDTHRHFGDAAAACNVTQPTLSGQLRRLEDELDVELIDRSHQPVVPTAAGESIVNEAREVLAARDRLAATAAEVKDRVTGTLRLGMLPTLSPYLLPLVLPSLETAYPEVSLVLREWPTTEILDALRTDALDAALIATDEAGPGLHDRVLFTEPFVGYVAPSHRLADRESLGPTALSIEDLWLLSEGHCFRDQVLQVCGRAPSAPQAAAQFESGSLETLVRLVRTSGGMTLLPRLATHHMPEAERATFVVPFADPPPTRNVRFVTRRRHKQRLLNAVVETLLKVLPSTVAAS